MPYKAAVDTFNEVSVCPGWLFHFVNVVFSCGLGSIKGDVGLGSVVSRVLPVANAPNGGPRVEVAGAKLSRLVKSL